MPGIMPAIMHSEIGTTTFGEIRRRFFTTITTFEGVPSSSSTGEILMLVVKKFMMPLKIRVLAKPAMPLTK